MRRFALLSLVALALAWGVSIAGPFSRFRPCVSPPLWSCGNAVSFPATTTPLAGCKEGECPVAAPSSPNVEMPFLLPQQGTVGEARPGTGLPSLSGLFVKDGKVKVELPDLSNVQLPNVKLSVSIPQETSASFDALAQRLHLLLNVSLAALGIFGGGKLLPLVTPVVSGLGRFLQALSSLQQPTTPSGAGTKSAGGNPGEATSIQKPAS